MYLILALLHKKQRLIKCHDTFGAVRDSRRLDTRFNNSTHHLLLFFSFHSSTRRRKTSDNGGVLEPQ